MSAFDVEEHGGVLLDDFGGKSPTMMHAFPFTLCRRAVVATMDNAAHNLNFFNTHHWLSIRQNVIVLRLTDTAFV